LSWAAFANSTVPSLKYSTVNTPLSRGAKAEKHG
jgi:hypothetical protein